MTALRARSARSAVVGAPRLEAVLAVRPRHRPWRDDLLAEGDPGKPISRQRVVIRAAAPWPRPDRYRHRRLGIADRTAGGQVRPTTRRLPGRRLDALHFNHVARQFCERSRELLVVPHGRHPVVPFRLRPVVGSVARSTPPPADYRVGGRRCIGHTARPSMRWVTIS